MAFAAPFVLGLFPRVRLPSVVVEIVAGIVVGPSVLGLVEVDQVIEVVALIGLGFVLFLAGLEIEFEKLRGQVLRLTALGFALSFAIALVVALGLSAGGLVETPLLVAIILCATSLGVIVPVLKDSGEISSPFGQLIVAAASIADFGAIILLTLFFSGEGGVGSTLLLLGALLVLAAVVFATVRGAERSMRIKGDLLRLQDTTAQIRIRAAIVLFVGFAAVAEELGFEVILGTFIAGAIISLLDRDEVMTHPDFRRKLEAMGFGFFIPVFFVTSGVRFDLDALLAEASNLAMVPVFLVALLRRARSARAAVPARARRAPHGCGRDPPGHLAAVHRRGERDRPRARPDRRGRERGADRRGPPVGARLPGPRPRRCCVVTPRAPRRHYPETPSQEDVMTHAAATASPRTKGLRGLEGKNVLVTGGSSGIGQAIAVRFAEYGANVAINYLRQPEEAAETEEQVQSCVAKVQREGVRDVLVQGDVSNEDDVVRMVADAIEGLGGIDVLVNNAGIQISRPTEELSSEDFDRVLAVNLRGSFMCAREAIRHFLAEEKAGSIVNISSVHQLIPKPGLPRLLGQQGRDAEPHPHARARVRRPRDPRQRRRPGRHGHPDQPRLDRRPREARARSRSTSRCSAPATRTRWRASRRFLASDEAAYITGQTIFVDGGLTLYPSFLTPWSSE